MSLNILLIAGAVAALVVVILLIAMIMVFVAARRRPAAERDELESIDIQSLSHADPPESDCRLEIYNVSVRLAAVVVAPSGRGSILPPHDGLPTMLDHLAPGLSDVFATHQPRLVIWPAQLSSQGFVRSFFRLAPLPGKEGKGTQWCSLAGRVEADDQVLLVGLICRAGKSNSLGRIVVEHANKWLDIVRVRV